MAKVSAEILLKLFERMYTVRKFEMKLYELAERGMVRGSVHLTIGEEATAVGTGMALNKEDYIITTHRGHGQAIAKGADLNRLMAEMIGKETGYCKGRVGSMHVADKETNNLGAQGIIGASFPISVGVGLAIKLKSQNAVLASYFGDGATNQGNFYEGLNFSDLWNLPVLFICINNQFGMGTRYCDTCNIEIYKKASIFNIISEKIDGNDVESVYLKTIELIEKMKEKKRPALLELVTYRWLGHSAFDKHPYRTKEEIEDWKRKDPIARAEEKLINAGISSDTITDVKLKVDTEIKEAEKFASESKYPDFINPVEK